VIASRHPGPTGAWESRRGARLARAGEELEYSELVGRFDEVTVSLSDVVAPRCCAGPHLERVM
jgi:hypothetical protein